LNPLRKKGTGPVPDQPLVDPHPHPQETVTATGVRPAVATGNRSALAGRFIDLVADELVATEAVFRHHLDSDVPFIHKAGEYISQGGGKRVRPALLLLAARLLGHDLGDEAVTYAAVVEFIHTATLIHDDIIDHATLRRGQRTLNHLWGNNLTVLLGDWIYTKAMQMALSHGQIEVIQRLCQATLKMTEGELLAFQRLGAPDLTIEEYFEIIDRKTAHLFAAACSIPSLIPPQRPEAGQVLARYGRALGICFQLVDDLLDFTARESELGKAVLSDLKEGKLTLPLILLLPRVDRAQRRLVEQVLEDRSFSRVSAQQILDLVRAEGTLEEVTAMAGEYAAEAKRELEFFPPSDAREALEFAPDFVLHRRS
jgi:octaprenyl-diphosphate synthase